MPLLTDTSGETSRVDGNLIEFWSPIAVESTRSHRYVAASMKVFFLI